MTRSEILMAVASAKMTVAEADKLLAASDTRTHKYECTSNPLLGNVSLRGMNSQMPVTLYMNQWIELLGENPDNVGPAGKVVVTFINQWKPYLSTGKGSQYKRAEDELIGDGKPFRFPKKVA